MRLTDITDEKTANHYLLEIQKNGLKSELDIIVDYCLPAALGKLKLMIERKNLIAAMTADEHLDLMLFYQELERMKAKIEKQKNEL